MPKQRPQEMDQLTDAAYYIVLTLLEPKHGYSIMQDIEDMTDDSFTIGPATLYTLLKKLLQEEIIELVNNDNPRRKVYQTTLHGQELLKKEMQRRKVMAEHGERAFQQLKGDQS
ncbi:PadR family transcriptional regulator [Bacillus mojavensis]|uniref:helix-turn-helix transcriptional regulator n=1 Tax=Bacillus mojavensis TaxID=72360 RepID=UPI000288E3EF|nr:helix-turn-helix transcriptional regulator [Bacillus mojavensis]MDR4228457.1 PadR family transcriptional regulator [Bacillus mojavensis]MEC3586844.1 helix-turn-helix transcriptional regulator [Bacillus mojavensis]MEC5242034.1 helix-turn-helix transcriptional regulator [Bacillus mojavensis]MED0748981.1 helix-turn-helix transcriptional regulator [Bacillus mojavensis]